MRASSAVKPMNDQSPMVKSMRALSAGGKPNRLTDLTRQPLSEMLGGFRLGGVRACVFVFSVLLAGWKIVSEWICFFCVACVRLQG